ncbi:D-alanyl-D-alanine carboxypeptidase/D-alanyl-D-alanine-endopeptidase [Candidatus Synechococcus calcipolaris G9]|uniref:D-alanyl-D-alanine carboxypeptidase/D-alanyl-D-alanine-endopeptidase n=1 Tax=Candidatus Synechococcus calcipolaris G9 TaxID=1497997 RepID=A0ABT6F347_9SYNE|nr:D-alanyl-D-alanine carboxypeptidase/D-alanyl-D-alanine-endopeptidase [Candidatus Synechococcus calcipolaris]MDG2992277.1 D-alanyl-D-alanine carboxypeptidase/D-alanyl-D-alanine-endopeptidase [Candidatus Synechococcus calcipolaris G9]
MSLVLGSLLLGLGIFAIKPAPALGQNNPAHRSCVANVAQDLSRLMDRPEWQRGRWGVQVVRLRDGQVIYERDSDRLFLGASNIKLVTTAVALRFLGANTTLDTVVSSDGAGAALNRVRVQGGYDPTLSYTNLEAIAQDLYRQGIRSIQTLELVAGESVDMGIEPTWAWEDVEFGYITPITKLGVNQNSFHLLATPKDEGEPLTLTWRQTPPSGWQVKNETMAIGPEDTEWIDTRIDPENRVITIVGKLRAHSEPENIVRPLPEKLIPDYLKNQFSQAARAAGLSVADIKLVATDQPLNRVLVRHSSPGITRLVDRINQDSHNYSAEMVYQAIGAGDGDRLATYLRDLGLDPTTIVMVDGSGLSRQNWITPRALTQLLLAMDRSTVVSEFRRSLPIAGESGTLRHRFRDTPAQGQLQAKTGTLRGVTALSGYMDPPDFEPLAFSIILNQGGTPSPDLRRGVDQVALLLMGLRQC